MARKKGSPKTGGRQKGVANSVTTSARELILRAIDNQSAHFDETMNQIRQKNPGDWAKIVVKLMDFVLPKKVDVTSEGKGINVPVIKWTDDDNDKT